MKIKWNKKVTVYLLRCKFRRNTSAAPDTLRPQFSPRPTPRALPYSTQWRNFRPKISQGYARCAASEERLNIVEGAGADIDVSESLVNGVVVNIVKRARQLTKTLRKHPKVWYTDATPYAQRPSCCAVACTYSETSFTACNVLTQSIAMLGNAQLPWLLYE